ncbi:hypothetical protein KKF81_06970 [Candidatus Micrarchaeota archaeon]|nr:hypothetical protein [Candidatus Micrarchaeota archaeon]
MQNQQPVKCLRMQKMLDTARKLFQTPMADRLMRKQTLKVLDFGCGDSTSTVALTRMLLEYSHALGMTIIGVNADQNQEEDCIVQFNSQRCNSVLAIFNNFMLSDGPDVEKFKKACSTDRFDIITIFNPGPPAKLLEMMRKYERDTILFMIRNNFNLLRELPEEIINIYIYIDLQKTN